MVLPASKDRPARIGEGRNVDWYWRLAPHQRSEAENNHRQNDPRPIRVEFIDGVTHSLFIVRPTKPSNSVDLTPEKTAAASQKTPV